MTPRFKPVADCALLVEFATKESEAVNQTVIALDRALTDAAPKGMTEVTPALVNLLIDFDPVLTDHAELEAAVRSLLPVKPGTSRSAKTHVIDMCYEDEYAPDLDDVAKACGLTRAQVIETHMAAEFYVSMYGFAPGYAYQTGVPEVIQVPRKSGAVRDVPKGSVIIAGAQCIIMTLTMPAGWAVIGRSKVDIVRDDPDRPFLFDVGDKIKYRAISKAEFEA